MTSCGKLREAAKAGNIDSLYAVIRKDPYILDRIDQVPFIDTPVHVAVTSGQDDFAVEVMNLKPSLARKLNTDGYSPIHLAIQNERMVLRLLEIDKDLVRVKGREGYTPLHCAAEQGNLRLLAQFLVDYPECVRDVTIRSETALHIAAKNNKLEAVQVLAQSLRRTYFYSSSMGKKLLNWKDKDGNTALHVAAYNNQPQMIKFLLDCKVKVNEINSSGKTPLDVIQELQTPDEASKRDSMKILRNAEALNASLTPRSRHLHQLLRTNITGLERALGELFLDITNMSTERSSAVLVILVLILTSTYQATLSPPGGVLQADSKDPTNQDSHGFAPPKTLQIYGFKSRYMYIYHSRSSKFRIEGDKKHNHMNSEGGKSTLNSRDFLLFYVPNTIAFIMTFILTLGLLAVVASGITWLLLPPLLLLYFCLLSSTFAISPANAPVFIAFAPLLSLPIMFRVIGHAKCLRKYTG
ncbi:hypothetical protein PVK06_016957 [Gossypium arboreum]|uniref:PGG domain-containing protein n=1 Tax=Gossypium arboreum TaxID=29729 RepID=A0ABR0Q1X3_GOSAR|nr:hypothetical protein PVK06_016957 [Gossypium arboreum]